MVWLDKLIHKISFQFIVCIVINIITFNYVLEGDFFVINGNEQLDNLPLAMAYVPMQKWRNIYEADVGLDRGTMFCELDLPFLGDRRDGK